MGLGDLLINLVESRRQRLQRSATGPLGDYYRNGGNDLLFDVPAETGGLVIDAGGYEGQWTARILAKYGCSSVIFEPIPRFAAQCKALFARNGLVTVRAEALGGSDQVSTFSLEADGSSEFGARGTEATIDAPVVDISGVLGKQSVDCLKLNIEGGEYEVLERLTQTGQISQCRSVLVQFHRQPPGWEARYEALRARLEETHVQDWAYPMVWEKWTARTVGVGR